jgi:hypothetical protein
VIELLVDVGLLVALPALALWAALLMSPDDDE